MVGAKRFALFKPKARDLQSRGFSRLPTPPPFETVNCECQHSPHLAKHPQWHSTLLKLLHLNSRFH